MTEETFNGIRFVKGDSMHYMAQQPRGAFDIVFSDPPYGENGNSHRRNHSRSKLHRLKREYPNALWSQQRPKPAFFEEIKRVGTNQIVFGANYFNSMGQPFKTPRRPEIEDFLKKHPKGWIAWDKCGKANFNHYELIKTSFHHKSFVYTFMWNGMLQGRSALNGHEMQAIKSLNEKRIHPTQKPVALYKYLLAKYAKQGYKILDTHGGGMSIAIACYEMGLDLTICEIEDEYFDPAVHRVKKYIIEQPQLFPPGSGFQMNQ